MLDQEEHSAETENGERGEVIKGRTEVDERDGESTKQEERGCSERNGQQVKKSWEKVKRMRVGQRGRKLIPFFLFLFMMGVADI